MSEDHPRSRGEYFDERGIRPIGYGSSPLSRGILRAGTITVDQSRIIPALAGNTGVEP